MLYDLYGSKTSFDEKSPSKFSLKKNSKSRNLFKAILKYEEVDSIRRTLNDKYYDINRHDIYFRENNIYQDSKQILDYLKNLPKPVFITDKNYSNKNEKKSRRININIKREKRLYSEKYRQKLEAKNKNIPHELFDYIHPHEYYTPKHTYSKKIIYTGTPLKSMKKSQNKLILSAKITDPKKRVKNLFLKNSHLLLTSNLLQNNLMSKKPSTVNDDIKNIKQSPNKKTTENVNNIVMTTKKKSQITLSSISNNVFNQKILAERNSRKSNSNKITQQSSNRNDFNYFSNILTINQNSSIVNSNNNINNAIFTKSNTSSKKNCSRIFTNENDKDKNNSVKIKSRKFIDQISNINKELTKLNTGIKNAFTGDFYSIKPANIKKVMQKQKKNNVNIVNDVLNKNDEEDNEEPDKNIKLCNLMKQNRITELFDNIYKYNLKSYDGMLGKEFLVGLKKFHNLQAKENFIKGHIHQEFVKKEKHKKTEKEEADESRKNLSNNISIMKSLWYKVNDHYK